MQKNKKEENIKIKTLEMLVFPSNKEYRGDIIMMGDWMLVSTNINSIKYDLFGTWNF